MHAAAQRLLGKHDFHDVSRHRMPGEIAGEDVDQLDVIREGDRDQDYHVGTLVPAQPGALDGGSLVWVGEGRWSADDLAAALAARNRAACGPVAAGGAVSGAGGLLTNVVAASTRLSRVRGEAGSHANAIRVRGSLHESSLTLSMRK